MTAIFAPWVVSRVASEGGNYVLGPRLNLVRITGELSQASVKQLDELIRMGIVRESAVPSNKKDFSLHKISEAVSYRGRSGARKSVLVVVVPDGNEICAMAAERLLTAANKSGIDWQWRIDCEFNVEQSDEHERFVLPISLTEKRMASSLIESYLARKMSVIWSGESEDGPHIGPLLSSMTDWENYESATVGWASSVELLALGFDTWPNTAPLVAIENPMHFVVAIANLLELPSGFCELLDEYSGSRQLWTEWEAAKPNHETIAKQSWAKGLFKNVQVTSSQLIPSVVLVTCRAPAPGFPSDLEINSGKGVDVEGATASALGEALERFSAMIANNKLSILREKGTPSRHYDLSCFHPWGTPYDEYLAAGSPSLPEIIALSSHSGELVAVPECLVPFPYLSEGNPRPTLNDTSGLACHPDRIQAQVRAASELLERNSLYDNLLHERPGFAIDPTGLDLGSRGLEDFALRAFRASDERLWLVCYESWEFSFHIVHAFYKSRSGDCITRSSGSGFTVSSAVRASVLELAQTSEQTEQGVPTRWGGGHRSWATSEAVDRLTAYLDSMEIVVPQLELDPPTPLNQVRVLEEVFVHLGSEMLVIEIPVQILGRWTLRVLGPGLVCNFHKSNSTGGRRLFDRTFPYPVPC